MKTLKIIRDSDFGIKLVAPQIFKERKACRCVVLDKDNKIALIHATKNGYYKLPGGGMEEGEEMESSLKRELVEEIGCTVQNINELGVVEEFRNKIELHQISYSFIADVEAVGTPELIEIEIAEGYETVWLDIDAAIEILEKTDNIDPYNGKFVMTREVTILKEAKAFISNK